MTKCARIGLDVMRPGQMGGPNVAEVKRSGRARARGSDCDSCEHLDGPSSTGSRMLTGPLCYAPVAQGNRAGTEIRVSWQIKMLRNVMRRICQPPTTRLSQAGTTGLRL